MFTNDICHSIYIMDGDRKVHHIVRVETLKRALKLVDDLPSGSQWMIEEQRSRSIFLGDGMGFDDTPVARGVS